MNKLLRNRAFQTVLAITVITAGALAWTSREVRASNEVEAACAAIEQSIWAGAHSDEKPLRDALLADPDVQTLLTHEDDISYVIARIEDDQSIDPLYRNHALTVYGFVLEQKPTPDALPVLNALLTDPNRKGPYSWAYHFLNEGRLAIEAELRQ